MYFLCLLLTTMAVMYAMLCTQLNNVFFISICTLFKLKSSLPIRCDIMGVVYTIFPYANDLEIVISSINLS